MASILAIIATVVKAVADALAWGRQKALIALGAIQQEAKDLRGERDAGREADRIRENAVTKLDRAESDELRSDDGFQRKSDD